jgi:hypothetical protein
MWISALVTLVNLALAGAVGFRLLSRSYQRESGPEGWLAGYFLCGALLGSALNIAVYSSLGEGGLLLDPTLTGRLLMLATAANGFAGTCIYIFTWKTFRSDEAWAASLVWIGACLFATTWIFQAATGEFVIRVFPGPAYWLERTTFTAAFAWAAIESFRYYQAMGRRLRIGLGEPSLLNRFGLWTLWASATGALALSDLVARIAYYWQTGEATTLLVSEAMPIVVVTIAVTAVIGAVAAASLWLTFFPTQRYLRWVEARAEA